MPADLIHSLFAHVWSIFLVVLFFGGSIFVHELGHFLAARWRGARVERFSIGFGPAIWSRRGEDGVEYRVAWVPLGGYVLLPQLADLGALEGKSDTDASQLPTLDYLSKMIVFVAGATFNVLFAFGLACILFFTGVHERKDFASTEIGYVNRTIPLSDGTPVAGPAFQAGIRIGDTVRAVDGSKVSNWTEVRNALLFGSGRDPAGHPQTILTIERDGHLTDVTMFPVLSTEEKVRKVGLAPAFDLIVHDVGESSPAGQAGFLPNDLVISLDGVSMRETYPFAEYVDTNRAKAIQALIRRGGHEMTLAIKPRPNEKEGSDFGVTFDPGIYLAHHSPYILVRDQLAMAFQTLGNLLNPHSDIGLSKLSGPIGIVHMLSSAAEVNIREVLLFAVMVNVSLAVFNLLPIPVLDGGQMLFATIGRLRGRALPVNFVMTTQSVFLVLILSMVVYVSFFDVRRWARDEQAERAASSTQK